MFLLNIAHAPPVPACPPAYPYYVLPHANAAVAKTAGRWLASGAPSRYGGQIFFRFVTVTAAVVVAVAVAVAVDVDVVVTVMAVIVVMTMASAWWPW